MFNRQNLRNIRSGRSVSRGARNRVRIATNQERRLLATYIHAIMELKVVYRLLVTAASGIRAEMGHGSQNRAQMGQADIDARLAEYPYAEPGLSLTDMSRLTYEERQPSQRDVLNAQRVGVNRIRELENAINIERSNITIAVNNFKNELEARFRANGATDNSTFRG